MNFVKLKTLVRIKSSGRRLMSSKIRSFSS